MKSEKGSITLFVLCACLLIVIAFAQVVVYNNNKLNSEKEKQKIIEQQYNSDNADEVYEKAIQNI